MHRGDPSEITVEERGREGEGEEEGVVLEEEILKHMKERMVKEMIEVEDPYPMDMEDIEEDLVVQTSVENLMDWTHLNLTPCLY